MLFNFSLLNNCALIYTQWFIDDYLSKIGCYEKRVRTANNLWTNVLSVCISTFLAMLTPKSFALWRIFQRSISERDVSHPVKLSSKRHRLKPFEVSPHDCNQSFAANLRIVIAYERLFSHPMKLNSEKQKRRPLRQTSTRLVPSPLRCLSPVIRFKTLFLIS